MQSILQYRRLRATLREELENHKQEKERRQDREPRQSRNSKLQEGDDVKSRDETTDFDKRQDEKHDLESGKPPPSPATSSSSDLPAQVDKTGLDVHLPGIEPQSRDAQGGNDSEDGLYMVNFSSDDDPLNPKNWSTGRKWRAMGIVGTTGFIVGWASSIDSAVVKQATRDFGVSELVESFAGTGIFLVAFGLGSLVAGPFSETVGRNPVYIVSLSLFMVFVMASALAPNIGAQLAFRFLAGLFGCTPLTTFGGSMADLFHPVDRTYVFPVCSSLSFFGPFLAPMVGAFIGASTLSWRWAEWVTLIITGAITLSIFFFVPETYAPILLKWKAEHLRTLTGDDRFRAPIEADQTTLATKLLRNSYRPLQMFLREIMVTLFTLYLVVVYIVLFGFLVGYDFIFGETHHFSQRQVGLSFIGMNVGFLVAFAIVPFIYSHYTRQTHAAERSHTSVPPEQRLWYAMLGAPFLPISLFWMSWTTFPSVSPWSPLVASIPFGFAVQAIFISTYQYLIDTYEAYAASALVTATLFRYVAAGAMQVVSLPMYENLGVNWALTLLACISLLMTPVPYVFYFKGHAIRQRFSAEAKA